MGEIPADYLPPKEHLPEKIYPLPEVRFPQKMNLGHLFLDRHIIEGKENKIAFLYKNQKITFIELQREVNRFANAMRRLGIEKGDRFMLRSPNRPEFIVGCFACWKIGAIPVLVSHLLRSNEIVFRANDSEAKAILVSSDAFSEVEKSLGKFQTMDKIIIFGDKIKGYLSYNDLLRDQPEQTESAETTRNDWARLIYSSGTTGNPKGILNTIGDTVAGIAIPSRYLLNLSPKDVIGGHPAFTFAYGFFSILFFGYNGCTLSIVDQFTPEILFETIERHGITVLRCVPTVYHMMLEVKDAEKKYNVGSLRLCQSAGEWLPGATAKKWKQRFGVELLDFVGSADLNAILSTRVGMPENKLDSSGIPFPGVECKIVDENFCEVPQGVAGELIVRAPWGLQYWRRPDIQSESVKQGWNRTGLIYVEDQDGYFWYKGRNDDMIVTSGYKVHGGEVEAVLLTHKAIIEAAVVPSPDPIRGNIIKAFIVLKDGFIASNQLAEEIKDFVKDKIEVYKYPREIEFIDGESLPRTVTGKIKRFVLRQKEMEKINKGEQKV
jgi:2-aminobenzoate-CoA ligase